MFHKIAYVFLLFILVSITFIFCFELFIIYLQFNNRNDTVKNIDNKIAWKIDATFKNDSNNIWHKPVKNK
jgi:hypothetical protein